jgi:hypothetical protein
MMDLTEQPLNKLIQRMAVAFAAAFAVCCVAVAVYEVLWVMPAKRCLENNGWWDPATRLCGTPIYIPDLTHRAPGAPKLTPLSR